MSYAKSKRRKERRRNPELHAKLAKKSREGKLGFIGWPSIVSIQDLKSLGIRG